MGYMGTTMRQSTSSFRATFVMLIFVSSLVLSTGNVAARSVHSIDTFDLLPPTPFADQNDWNLSTQVAYSPGTPADYTTAMVTDNHLSFTHQRPLNTQSTTLWATTNTTDGHGYSTGAADGGYAWSAGPEITVGSFPTNGLTSNSLYQMELVLSFNVPDALQQDSVRISLNWNGSTNDLVKEFRHTQSALSYMDSPYWSIDISDLNLTWTDLPDLWVTADYVSVGGTDDSRLELDAVGLHVTYQAMWFGIESATAESYVNGEWPVVELDLTTGEHEEIIQSSCGLELSVGSISGTWDSDALSLPPSQNWGRIHSTGSWTGDIYASVSEDGDSWTSPTLVLDHSQMLPTGAFLKIEIELTGGCLESLKIDYNDPTLTVDWMVSGDHVGLNNSASWVQLTLEGDLIFKEYLVGNGNFSQTVKVGEYLPADGDDLDLVFAAVYTWESDGTPGNALVQIEGVSINGGFHVEWDENPVCMANEDLQLTEDGGGRLIPMLLTCSDDRTLTANLGVAVSQDNTDSIEVDMVDDQLRIRLLSESSGSTLVSIEVSDAAGNKWYDTFSVNVAAVNDAPVLDQIQSTMIIGHGEYAFLDLSFSDIDSPVSSLDVQTSYSWAVWDEDAGHLVLTPTQQGTFDLEIIIDDGDLTAVRHISIEVAAFADLVIEGIDVIGDVIAGTEVEIQVHVRNTGQASATLVEIRCEGDGQLIRATTIAEINSGQVRTATCAWMAPMDDDAVLLQATVDKGNDIAETDDDNNILTKAVNVFPSEDNGGGSSDGVTEGISLSPTVMWGGTILGLVVLIALFVVFSPPAIRKIE